MSCLKTRYIALLILTGALTTSVCFFVLIVSDSFACHLQKAEPKQGLPPVTSSSIPIVETKLGSGQRQRESFSHKGLLNLLDTGSDTTNVIGNIAATAKRLTEADMRERLETAYRRVEPLVTNNSAVSETNDSLSFREVPTTSRVLYFITPTCNRSSQMVDLTRLKQTLELAILKYGIRIYWIIVEDRKTCTKRIRDMLLESNIENFAHVVFKTPVKYTLKHRGIAQRNYALELIETQLLLGNNKKEAAGVVYFGDDDNAYDIQLMTELLYTRRVSVFGVGYAGGLAYERCQVDEKTGKVIKIFTGFKPDRKFPIDMAGFAFSTDVLIEVHPRFDNNWPKGYIESNFISLLVNHVSELEPLAANCTKILAWRVLTARANMRPVPGDKFTDILRQY